MFDTLLQVLILKKMEGLSGIGERRDERGSPGKMVSTLEPTDPEGGIPRVFWEKRLEVIENKGRECGKEGKEK